MTKKVGELANLTYWVKVVSVESPEKLLVEDLNSGNKFFVQGKELVESMASADNFVKTEKLTKTAMAEKLISLYGRPFTVNFDEQSGKNRTLRGRLLNPEPLLGRSYVEDLDIPLGQHRLRQVDHRTINWLICEGTKFVVKS